MHFIDMTEKFFQGGELAVNYVILYFSYSLLYQEIQ